MAVEGRDVRRPVVIAGHTKALSVVGWRSSYHRVEDGIAFQFGNEGSWVVDFNDLCRIVDEGKEIRSIRGPDFMSQLSEVADSALDNMEGEGETGFKNWERVHCLARKLKDAIATAERPQ